MTVVAPAFLNAPIPFFNGTTTKRLYCGYKLPANYDPSQSYPAVMVFHGTGGSGQQMANVTNLIARTDDYANGVPGTTTQGFIALFPQSQNLINTQKQWDTSDPVANPASDIAWIQQCTAFLAAMWNISFFTFEGYSQGAGMAVSTHHYFPTIARGIALVDWNLSDTTFPFLQSGYVPVEWAVTHGTDDPVIPEEGGEANSGELVWSSLKTAQNLAQLNGCANPSTPDSTTILPATTNDPSMPTTTVNSFLWNPGTSGHGVFYDRIIGTGHTVPDGNQRFGANGQGIVLGSTAQYGWNIRFLKALGLY